MLLYHGTTKVSAQSICRGINLKASQGRLDFGKGFYLTANKGRANYMWRCFEMVLDKYARKMNDQRYYYCYTVLELVKRGYSGKEAKAMVKASPLTKQINSPESWAYMHDMGKRDWADMVEKCHNLARRGKL